MIKRFLILPLTAALLLLFAPCGWASDYYTGVVAQLNLGNRVYVDDGANPTLPNPTAVNDQIIQTGLPLVVVNIAAGQTVNTSGGANHATDPVRDALYATHNPLTANIQVNGQPHKPPLIILVIDHGGYHAWGYDVNQSIADSTGPNILQAAAAHHGDLNGAVSAFVSLMVGTPATGPVVSNLAPPPPPPAPTNWAFAWALLWIAVAGGVIAIIAAVFRTIYIRRQDKIAERNAVQDRINQARKAVDRLATEVLKGKDVSTEQNSATMSVGTAEKAFERGDLANARSHVGIAERDIQAAYRIINPDAPKPARSHVTAMKDIPKTDRRVTHIAATSPSGKPVKIRNNDYRTRKESGYTHYYPGGYVNNVYFPAGYWPYLFWTDNWAWNSHDINVANTQLPTPTPSDYGYSSGGGNASVAGSHHGSHSGGGSAGYTAPRHHTPSYDSGSSSSGGSAGFGSFGGGFGGGFGGDSSGGGNASF